MNLSASWYRYAKRFTYLATLLTLSSLSLTTLAAPLDQSKIQFIGPLAEGMQAKPFQTPHGDVVISNLLTQLESNTESFVVFGKKHKWQPLDKINALTLGGLQAVSYTHLTLPTTPYV